MVRVSKFYKEAREGKFVSFLHSDARTLYDTFRRGAKESSKCLGVHVHLMSCTWPTHQAVYCHLS